MTTSWEVELVRRATRLASLDYRYGFLMNEPGNLFLDRAMTSTLEDAQRAGCVEEVMAALFPQADMRAIMRVLRMRQ